MPDDFWRRICVIIPVYNAKNYLYEAVISVLNQEYKKIEIILIDDGSNDGSSQICDDLVCKFENIFVIHQNNSGVSVARNTGMNYIFDKYCDKLKGIYVTFLDADDAWINNFFTEGYILKFPEVDLICFQSLLCNNKISRCHKANRMEEGVYNGGKKTVQLCQCHFGACLYEAYFLKKYNLQFVEKLSYAEDTQFFRKCICTAKEIALYNKPFYLYRNNPVSAVHNRKFGIDYFEPIFAAYLVNDSDGSGFVSWYLADMIQEHFQHFGTITELKQWLISHDDYVSLARMHGGERGNSVLGALEKAPKRYALKNYIEGAFHECLKRIICLSGISKLVEQIRYPIPLEQKIYFYDVHKVERNDDT